MKTQYQVAKEALKLSNNGYKEMYPLLFAKNQHRIYLDFGDLNINLTELDSNIEDINSCLNPRGYTIVDYKKGICEKQNDKNVYKIGKLLRKYNQSCLLSIYNNDPYRVGQKNLALVVSRHPYDLACASYNRSWHSCLNFETGGNRNRLKNMIEQNSVLICYLINKNDKGIKNPLGRILIYPYETEDKKVWLRVVVREYGLFYKPLIVYLNSWLDKNYNNKTIKWDDDTPSIKFKHPKNCYNDNNLAEFSIINPNFKSIDFDISSGKIIDTYKKYDRQEMISKIKKYLEKNESIKLQLFYDCITQNININNVSNIIDFLYQYKFKILRNQLIEKCLIQSSDVQLEHFKKYLKCLKNSRFRWKKGVDKIKLLRQSVDSNENYNFILQHIT